MWYKHCWAFVDKHLHWFTFAHITIITFYWRHTVEINVAYEKIIINRV
jgi:hypothetical protein